MIAAGSGAGVAKNQQKTSLRNQFNQLVIAATSKDNNSGGGGGGNDERTRSVIDSAKVGSGTF